MGQFPIAWDRRSGLLINLQNVLLKLRIEGSKHECGVIFLQVKMGLSFL